MHLKEAIAHNGGTAINRSSDPALRVVYSSSYEWEKAPGSYDVHMVDATTGANAPRYLHVTLADAERYAGITWAGGQLRHADQADQAKRLDPNAWE